MIASSRSMGRSSAGGAGRVIGRFRKGFAATQNGHDPSEPAAAPAAAVLVGALLLGCGPPGQGEGGGGREGWGCAGEKREGGKCNEALVRLSFSAPHV